MPNTKSAIRRTKKTVLQTSINRIRKSKYNSKNKCSKNTPHNNLSSVFWCKICCDHADNNGIVCSHHNIDEYYLNEY